MNTFKKKNKNNKKDLKIAIFGAYGLLGSFLSNYLISNSYKVFRQGRGSNADYKLDPINYSMVKDFYEDIKPDIIVNLNAITNVDFCEENPNLAYIGNVESTISIVKNIDKNKTHLIHISTDQVYDGLGPHIEENASPLNIYAKTKYESEIIAKKVNATILRTNFVGKSFSKSKKSFTDWLVDSFNSNKQINLFNDIKFSAIHQKFLASIIEESFFLKPSEIINIGCIDSISKAEFALKLSNSLNYNFKNYKLTSSENIFRPARRPKDMTLNTEKFSEIFNIESPTVEDTIKIIKKDYEKI